MADYIKRDALLEARELAICAYENARIFNADAIRNHLKPLLDGVVDTPAADVSEVVRCKYCIRRYDTDECPMCFLIEGKYYEYTNENGFCDRGERKEGANND